MFCQLFTLFFSPLDGMDESAAFVEPAMLGHGTPRRRPVSVIALNGEYVSANQHLQKIFMP